MLEVAIFLCATVVGVYAGKKIVEKNAERREERNEERVEEILKREWVEVVEDSTP